MNNIIYLDLNKETLFGWERVKSDLVIDSIIKGIEAGDDFPTVPVCKDKCGNFYLVTFIQLPGGLTDGGHHRAVGHYIAGKPLKCELSSESLSYLSRVSHIPDIAIKDVIIGDDTGQYKENKKRFPDYR